MEDADFHKYAIRLRELGYNDKFLDSLELIEEHGGASDGEGLSDLMRDPTNWGVSCASGGRGPRWTEDDWPLIQAYAWARWCAQNAGVEDRRTTYCRLRLEEALMLFDSPADVRHSVYSVNGRRGGSKEKRPKTKAYALKLAHEWTGCRDSLQWAGTIANAIQIKVVTYAQQVGESLSTETRTLKSWIKSSDVPQRRVEHDSGH